MYRLLTVWSCFPNQKTSWRGRSGSCQIVIYQKHLLNSIRWAQKLIISRLLQHDNPFSDLKFLKLRSYSYFKQIHGKNVLLVQNWQKHATRLCLGVKAQCIVGFYSRPYSISWRISSKTMVGLPVRIPRITVCNLRLGRSIYSCPSLFIAVHEYRWVSIAVHDYPLLSIICRNQCILHVTNPAIWLASMLVGFY